MNLRILEVSSLPQATKLGSIRFPIPWILDRLGWNLTLESSFATTTVPDLTPEKILLVGSGCEEGSDSEYRSIVVVFLDFADTRSRECEASDCEE